MKLRVVILSAVVLLAAPAASVAAVGGDQPSEFGQIRTIEPVATVTSKLGDTPADFPGASRAPEAPPAVAVIRERATVQVVDDPAPVLPIVLSAVALAAALGAAVVVGRMARAQRALGH